MIGSTESRFDLSHLGERFESPAVEITAEAARRFAEATNDGNQDFIAGRLAPPLYAVVPVLRTMVAAKNAITSQFAFHGEHDLVVREPLRPGMTVIPRATVIGVRQRSVGVATIVRVETSTPDGTLLNEQYFTSFVSGGTVEVSAGEDAPAHVPSPPSAGAVLHEITLPFDPDQTRRFAAASGDWDAYTLDEDAARELGFPTIIVHGVCTMAFAGRAVVDTVCGRDARRLARLAMRLSRPLFLVPGQALTTRIWAVASDSGREFYGFEAIDQKGETVIKNGWAAVTL